MVLAVQRRSFVVSIFVVVSFVVRLVVVFVAVTNVVGPILLLISAFAHPLSSGFCKGNPVEFSFFGTSPRNTRQVHSV